MQNNYTEGKLFEKLNLSLEPLGKGEYENCTFKNCDFSNADLSDYKFYGCVFFGCNMSLAKLYKTAFMDVSFKECKLLGLLFENCNEHGITISFENCNLTHASFFKRKIKKTIFKKCMLQEVDFSECDLSGALFDNCDLMQAKFERSILEKADFRTAYNYALDPEINKLKKAKFAQSGLAGLLHKYDLDIDAHS